MTLFPNLTPLRAPPPEAPVCRGLYDGAPAELRWIAGDELAVMVGDHRVQSMTADPEAANVGVIETLKLYFDEVTA